MNNQKIVLLVILAGLFNLLAGCSMAKLSVRASLPLMQGSLVAMNQETDLGLAKTAMPANLMMVEGLIETDPDDVQLRLYAAQGLYSYAYGFIEDDDPKRASALYRRGLRHTQRALQLKGLNTDILHARRDDLERAVAALPSPLERAWDDPKVALALARAQDLYAALGKAPVGRAERRALLWLRAFREEYLDEGEVDEGLEALEGLKAALAGTPREEEALKLVEPLEAKVRAAAPKEEVEPLVQALEDLLR